MLSQYVRHNDQHMDSIEAVSAGSKSGVGVLDKSVSILAFLSRGGSASLANVVEGTGLPRPTAHRLLSALETHHLVSRQDGRLRAAVSISGPISRLTENPGQRFSRLVVDAAREIERAPNA